MTLIVSNKVSTKEQAESLDKKVIKFYCGRCKSTQDLIVTSLLVEDRAVAYISGRLPLAGWDFIPSCSPVIAAKGRCSKCQSFGFRLMSVIDERDRTPLLIVLHCVVDGIFSMLRR